MELTKMDKFLIDGLRLFNLPEEDQEAIFLVLQEEEQQAQMMDYLATHRDATGQDILKETIRILRATDKETTAMEPIE